MALLHRLFFAIRPPPGARREIGRLRDRSGGRIGSVSDDRLHITFLMLGEFAAPPGRLIARLKTLIPGLAIPACRVVFDKLVVDGRAARLVPSERLRGAQRAQRRLAESLACRGIGQARRWRFCPHLTLHYDPGADDEPWIEAISWLACELVLIESIVPRHRHVERGRWPLRSIAARSPP
jgi:2'-5' RNA ligase